MHPQRFGPWELSLDRVEHRDMLALKRIAGKVGVRLAFVVRPPKDDPKRAYYPSGDGHNNVLAAAVWRVWFIRDSLDRVESTPSGDWTWTMEPETRSIEAAWPATLEEFADLAGFPCVSDRWGPHAHDHYYSPSLAIALLHEIAHAATGKPPYLGDEDSATVWQRWVAMHVWGVVSPFTRACSAWDHQSGTWDPGCVQTARVQERLPAESAWRRPWNFPPSAWMTKLGRQLDLRQRGT